MACQSLILGVLFSIGIFAVKSGVGISCVVLRQERIRTKAASFLLFTLGYGFVFAAAALILPKIDPVRHLAAIQSFIQSGMLVHLVIAFTTTVTGLAIGTAAFFFYTVRRRWIEEDIKNMELATEMASACIERVDDHAALSKTAN
jgi:uncharacterized membrane protein